MTPLIGHQARFDALARAFTKNQTPQTLLLSGPPHIGKTTFVTRYAQLLLCPNTQTENDLPRGCESCPTCHQIEIGSFPDFRFFRPSISEKEPEPAPEALDSSIILKADATKFIREAELKPVNGPRKVIVMHQFERANESAQNALLKTLEEPPSSTKLILTTENPRRLRETILSRCWHLQLTPVGDAPIRKWLESQFPDSSTNDISLSLRAASGRPGAAWRELSRLNGEEENGQTRLEIASKMLAKLEMASPVAALGLTEEALKWAKVWWDEDAGDQADSKKLGAKGGRAAAAHFLDELMLAARAGWLGGAPGDAGQSEIHAARLDQMRKTRQYILRNANTNLALDVMFGRLIALRVARSNTR